MRKVCKSSPERMIEKWKGVDKGTGGLPRVTLHEIKLLHIDKIGEAVEGVGGAVVLAVEGIEEICVVMTMDKYFGMLPVNGNPKKAPMMLRQNGIMYREVV